MGLPLPFVALKTKGKGLLVVVAGVFGCRDGFGVHQGQTEMSDLSRYLKFFGRVDSNG